MKIAFFMISVLRSVGLICLVGACTRIISLGEVFSSWHRELNKQYEAECYEVGTKEYDDFAEKYVENLILYEKVLRKYDEGDGMWVRKFRMYVSLGLLLVFLYCFKFTIK